MVRLYLNEMPRVELGRLLRAAGHDVVRAAKTGQARADDGLILERVVRDERTLVTLDEHFGDWAVLPLSKHFGVIRVKAHPTSADNVARVLLPLLSNRTQEDFRNRLVIVSHTHLRPISTVESRSKIEGLWCRAERAEQLRFAKTRRHGTEGRKTALVFLILWRLTG